MRAHGQIPTQFKNLQRLPLPILQKIQKRENRHCQTLRTHRQTKVQERNLQRVLHESKSQQNYQIRLEL